MMIPQGVSEEEEKEEEEEPHPPERKRAKLAAAAAADDDDDVGGQENDDDADDDDDDVVVLSPVGKGLGGLLQTAEQVVLAESKASRSFHFDVAKVLERCRGKGRYVGR